MAVVDIASADAVRVFISYAHESEAHAEAVRDLWVLLRRYGVDAHIDRTAAEQRQDWPQWMMKQVREAAFVLVVASPAYARRAEGRAKADEGRGVQFEAGLILERLYRNQAAELGKILPVVLPGGSVDDIPDFLRPITTTSYRVEEFSLAGVERLLRVLTDQPSEVEPPPGPVPTLGVRPVTLSTETTLSTATAVKQGLARPASHELILDVAVADGRVSCRVMLAGGLLGERTAPIPAGMESAWEDLRGPLQIAEARLSDTGQRLRRALLDDATAERIIQLVDRSAVGTVVDVAVLADGVVLGWPYELLRLADGRLLAALPGVRLRRQVRGAGGTTVDPLPGPLKILAAVAAPEETRTRNVPLDVEAEMQAMVDAVGTVAGQVGAQVRFLEVASPTEITDALRADQYHVLHLSAHGSANAVELEDEDGNPVPVDAAALVDMLKAGRRPLPLLVLSSCASAEGGAGALAARLVDGGADRVLAMQASVTESYATRVAGELYRELAADPMATPAGALTEARRRLEDARQQRVRAGEPTLIRPEYGLPTLFAAGADPPLVDVHAQAAELEQPYTAPAGGSVRTLRLGELIGRRRELRTALTALRGGPKAQEQFGALAGAMLTGMGGIGKTAIAGRVLSRLAAERWATVVHVGVWNPGKLVASVADALAGRPGGESFVKALADPHVEEVGKLELLRALLAASHLLLLFDDFEQNLTPGGEAFRDPAFAETFLSLCESARVGRILVTCRYPVPEAGVYLLRIDVPALSPAELNRLLLRLGGLRGLAPEDRRVVTSTIGGHPRLLEFVDALLRRGRGTFHTEVTTRLRELARPAGVPVTANRGLHEAVDNAVLLGARDILLDELLDLLSEDERELFLQAAVSTIPLDAADLAAARWGSPTGEQTAEIQAALPRLLDLTLLTPAGDEEVVVHRWVEAALRDHHGDQFAERHRRALAMRLARFEAGRGAFADLAEIARHQAATGEYQDLIGTSLNVADMLGQQVGQVSVTAYLGDVMSLVRPQMPGYLPLADRELRALQATGQINAAQQRARAITTEAIRRAEADPTNAEAQRDLSISYERLGDLAVATGDLGEAGRAYRDSLAIAEQQFGQDSTQAEALRSKLGDLQ